jgi:hypothetical protein
MLDTHSDSLTALRTDDLQVGQVDGGFALHNAPLDVSLRILACVTSNDINILDDSSIAFGKYPQHPPRLAPVATSGNLNLIFFLDT